jgi:hypothetical protein
MESPGVDNQVDGFTQGVIMSRPGSIACFYQASPVLLVLEEVTALPPRHDKLDGSDVVLEARVGIDPFVRSH